MIQPRFDKSRVDIEPASHHLNRPFVIYSRADTGFRHEQRASKAPGLPFRILISLQIFLPEHLQRRALVVEEPEHGVGMPRILDVEKTVPDLVRERCP